MHMKWHVHHKRSVPKLQTNCGASFVPQHSVPEADVKRVESEFRAGGLVQQSTGKRFFMWLPHVVTARLPKKLQKCGALPKRLHRGDRSATVLARQK